MKVSGSNLFRLDDCEMASAVCSCVDMVGEAEGPSFRRG